MAKIILQYRFADGEIITASAEGKHAYPDLLAELKHEALEGFKDALAFTMAIQNPTPVVAPDEAGE